MCRRILSTQYIAFPNRDLRFDSSSSRTQKRFPASIINYSRKSSLMVLVLCKLIRPPLDYFLIRNFRSSACGRADITITPSLLSLAPQLARLRSFYKKTLFGGLQDSRHLRQCQHSVRTHTQSLNNDGCTTTICACAIMAWWRLENSMRAAGMRTWLICNK